MPCKDPARAREQKRIYRANNKARISESDRLYRENNKQEIAEHKKQYRQANPEKEAEVGRQYRTTHKPERAEYSKEWRETHRDYINESQKVWREANPEKCQAAAQRYRQTHKDEIAEHQKQYYEANPMRRRWQHINALAKRRGATGWIELEAFQILWESRGTCCPLCERPFGIGQREPTFDHRQPLAHGGKHSIENGQIICRGCNSDKGDNWQEG